MYYDKRYLQFNNLVFDGYDMISSTDEQTTYKEPQGQSYSMADGDYMPYKNDRLYLKAGSVSMTLTFWLKKIPCDDRPWYLQFIDQELSRPGKLWALRNGEIIWAYAHVRNKHVLTTYTPYKAEYDIEFTLPEGKWHKADLQRTFVLPYNVCVMMECKGFKPYNPCVQVSGGDCCESCQEKKFWEDFEDRCFCCCVDEITEDMALCYHTKELQKFYGCDTPFQLVYDCEHAEKFNKNDYLGQKICLKDGCEETVIAGRFYATTDMSTDEVVITIKGDMHNPWVTINGNTNIIKGDYNGALTIYPNGDVYYQANECCEPTLLDPKQWVIPSGMTYGWTVYPQNNSISVNLNKCCGGVACVYIDIDNITA